MKPDTSYIAALRFPLALLVVLIHALNAPWRDYFATNEAEACRMFAEGLSHVVTAFAVPLFFVISGYLFFLGRQTFGLKDYGEKLRRRVTTLVVPYLTWNVLAAVLYLLSGKDVPISLSVFWGCNPVGAGGINIFGGTNTATTGPVLLQLWFVRDLILLVLLSPLLHYIWRRLGLFGLLAIAAVYYANLWPNPLGVSFKGFWFFSLGAWMSLSAVDVPALARRFFKPAAAISVVLVGILTALPDLSAFFRGILLDVYVFSGALTAVGLASRLTRRRKPSRLLSLSGFFIYASHTIVLLPLTRTAIGLLNRTPSPALAVALYILCPVLATAACLFAFSVLYHFAPRLSRALTGLR